MRLNSVRPLFLDSILPPVWEQRRGKMPIPRPWKTIFRCLVAVLVVSQVACTHPDDERLLAGFEAHEAEFDTLVAMFEADKGLGRVGEDFTRPRDPGLVGVSTQRIEEYRALCSVVGATGCIEGYDDTYFRAAGLSGGRSSPTKDPMMIHVSSQGLSISGSSKGYLYSSHPEDEIVASLDNLAPTLSGRWLRHIRSNWYLYYEVEH